MRTIFYKMAAGFAAMAVALAVAGCEGFNDYQQQVKKLRILGVRADNPMITVTVPQSGLPSFTPPNASLDVIFGDPMGGGRPVSLYWAACPLMNMSTVGNFNCDGDNGYPLPDPPVFNPYSYLLWLISRGEPVDPATWLAIMQQTNGQLPVMIWLRATAGEESVVAVKNITFVITSDRNHNPRILDVAVNGLPLDSSLVLSSGAKYTFTPQIDPSSIETWVDPATGQTVTEDPMYTWYSSQGMFDNLYTDYKTPSVTWTAPVLDPGETVRLADFWIVLLDRRGGIDWYTATGVKITLPE